MNDTFNKKEFAALLKNAKGERSINKFAEESNISAAHISRFLRGLVDAPPTPETISKFADKAHNEVSYKDMMIAAGHIVIDESKVGRYSPSHQIKELRNLEQDMINIVIGYLMKQDFKWDMEKPEGLIRFPDMIVNLSDDNYTKWYFEFKAAKGIKNMIKASFYNQILTFELNPTDKFTLVINEKNTFDSIVKNPPINLKSNLFIMLVDLENRKVVEEIQVSKY